MNSNFNKKELFDFTSNNKLILKKVNLNFKMIHFNVEEIFI